jgi:hypothetical protein
MDQAALGGGVGLSAVERGTGEHKPTSMTSDLAIYRQPNGVTSENGVSGYLFCERCLSQKK